MDVPRPDGSGRALFGGVYLPTRPGADNLHPSGFQRHSAHKQLDLVRSLRIRGENGHRSARRCLFASPHGWHRVGARGVLEPVSRHDRHGGRHDDDPDADRGAHEREGLDDGARDTGDCVGERGDVVRLREPSRAGLLDVNTEPTTKIVEATTTDSHRQSTMIDHAPGRVPSSPGQVDGRCH